RDISYWEGYCPIHNNLSAEQVEKVKASHPKALFLAHPECPPEVLDLADEIKSTSGMIAFAVTSGNKELIIGTETGILYPMTKAAPDTVLIPADPDMICPDMKRTGLREIQRALEELRPEVKVPEEIGVKAKRAVDRMLSIPVS
ncbi:MAG: quinolinate synthase NadA, partial [Deltaproteobacteria bacterium]|nr:quinolinate synthase NadA [Deltaproteobacteria bacterium]